MKILIVFGTRPEALKCFPVAQVAAASPEFDVAICVTAQHRQMLDQVMTLTGMKADYDLNVMSPGQTLYDTTSRVLGGMAGVLRSAKPDVVLVQGDTTTAMAAALAAFYERIAVGHIEAGLRSGDIYSPWPEEMNRKLIGEIASIHFPPTVEARANLLREGKDPSRIFVTGNTSIDTLLHFSARIDADSALSATLGSAFGMLNPDKRLVLVTGHRRENFGDGIENICAALQKLAGRGDVEIVYPVHPNPNVMGPVNAALQGVAGIHLLPPQDYLPFVWLMKKAHLILTDSGGVQEEAPSLGKPVLVMRTNTERPEGVTAGTAILVGTDTDKIVDEAERLIDHRSAYEQMSQRHNPYGDGKAGERILKELLQNV